MTRLEVRRNNALGANKKRMIAWFIEVLFGRHASLKGEVDRLKTLVEKRNAERAALAEEQTLLKEIAGLRVELGIQ
jgi:hypothetical protein